MAKSKKPDSSPSPGQDGIQPVPVDRLRWFCNPEALPFDSTSEVEPVTGVVGQDDAVEALRFGLETDAPGQNIFVRGLSGTGRLTMVRRLLQEIRLSCPFIKDCCYVHNFKQPDQPRLITLPPGRGKDFQRRMDKLIDFIRQDLGTALNSEGIQARQSALSQQAKEELENLVNPFEEALKTAGLRLVTIQGGPLTQTALFPVVNDQPVPPEEFDQLHTQGKIPEEMFKAFKESYAKYEKQLTEINVQASEIRRKHGEAVQVLRENSARWILGVVVRKIQSEFTDASVQDFLNELVDDLVQVQLDNIAEDMEFTRRYRVNVVLDRREDGDRPVIAESVPNMSHLLGAINFDFGPGDEVRSNHMGISAGSLLRADGGYLILEALDVLSEPGAWRALMRTLRTGLLEIVPPEMAHPRGGPALKPEPIPINTKVVLLGDSETYYALDARDPDFNQLFKVLADFDTLIPRDDSGVNQYASVLARIAKDEQLPPFDRTGVATLVEHGARIASRKDRLTTRFSRIADIAREAAFITTKKESKRVSGEEVTEAIVRGKRRANLPARRFRELVADGTIRVETRGAVTGQINGLAVLQAGPIVYGFPARITATIGPGTAGVINIEREAALSGAIHTKGFYILGGLLRTLLRTEHPLAFDASVAFEQSYGGIDGDSASGAEICCLLSALTDLPLRQDLAMTGAIDQKGHILAVGAVNEKIEGFFDVCTDMGLTGRQGVIIPGANAGDLMLRKDVVEAAASDRFHIFAVDTVQEAIEILTEKPAGLQDKKGRYPRNSVLGTAVNRARTFWRMASQVPRTGVVRREEEST